MISPRPFQKRAQIPVPRLNPCSQGIHPQRRDTVLALGRGRLEAPFEERKVGPDAERSDIDEVVLARFPDLVRDEEQEPQRVEDATVGQDAEAAEEVGRGTVDAAKVPAVAQAARLVGRVYHEVEAGVGGGDAFPRVADLVRGQEVLVRSRV